MNAQQEKNGVWVIMATEGYGGDYRVYPAAVVIGSEEEAIKQEVRMSTAIGNIEDAILKEINNGATLQSELEDEDAVYTEEDRRLQGIYDKYMDSIKKVDPLWCNGRVEYGSNTYYKAFYNEVPCYYVEDITPNVCQGKGVG